MILGIGTDLVDSRRIATSLDRFGTRFESRIFTDNEIEIASSCLLYTSPSPRDS